ncbi:MAG: hypothetical protein KDA99_18660 [Planctomycetales bacterium]|nr:hypothetical protein [Planctomycetales bacterium]
MRLRLRFTLRTLLLIPLLFALTMAGVWWWPKSQPLSINEEFYTGHYRGLGLTNGTSFFGKRFFRLVVQDGKCGYWEVDYGEPGYNAYRGFYPDGVCREEGECFVEINGGIEDPAPDSSNVRWGKYYKPDGTLDSEVVNGTGTQTFWYPNGTKRWELVLRDYARLRHSMWFDNGQLSQTQHYVDGEVDGKFESFHKNGTVRLQGEYANGDREGVWTRFDENGKVTSIEDYSVSPPKITRP